ncbi:Rrf2 family transcriptional regulator [Zavarzinia compransoris]|uniref:RrF2 family transcriptional regulator n=1 Tax=Zavarzinia marina TaxID=2911065 RepID=UPI001F275180|nr:Rrf2 family transcriptional regulator [Zavarzinia marina]MCF4167452.1 Rrf2 family transcriptional regulator [Zavarzinia marina]
MLRLSRKMLFALEAVVDIAYNARPEPVQSKEITRRQGIPQRYLEQVMQQLVHAGVLKGVRGPKGGYRLARERRRITVGEIIRTVGAFEAGDEDDGDGAPMSSELGRKVVQPLWSELHETIMSKLDSITVEDLCRRAEGAGVKAEGRERMDFEI